MSSPKETVANSVCPLSILHVSAYHDWLNERHSLLHYNLNMYPQVYLQTIFEFFREHFNRNFDSQKVCSFLQEFGYLPPVLDPVPVYYHKSSQLKYPFCVQSGVSDCPKVVQLWNIFCTNQFYDKPIPNSDLENPPVIRLPFNYTIGLADVKRDPADKSLALVSYKELVTTLLKYYDYYCNRAERKLSGHELLNPMEVFKIKVAYSLTLYSRFEDRLRNLALDGEKILTAANSRLERFMVRMDGNVLEREIYVRSIFNLLAESPRIAQLLGLQTSTPYKAKKCKFTSRCLEFLVREKLFREDWETLDLVQASELMEHATHPDNYNQVLDPHKQDFEWVHYLSWIAILPDPRCDLLTNGFVLDLLVDTLVHWYHESNDKLPDSEFNCLLIRTRNLIVWIVIIVRYVMGIIDPAQAWLDADNPPDDVFGPGPFDPSLRPPGLLDRFLYKFE